jgi:ATP-binding cassette subfamily F protein 3
MKARVSHYLKKIQHRNFVSMVQPLRTNKDNNTGISILKLRLSFNGKPVFQDVDFQLSAGDKVTIVGENGVGKSTFLKIINGLIHDYEGKAIVKGSIGYLPQSFEGFANLKGIEHLIRYSEDPLLIEFLENSDSYRSDAWYQEFNARGGFAIWKTLSQLRLNPDRLERNLMDLSGGEKTKLHLCAIHHQNPDVLLLDEPTNHLDYTGLRWLENFLRSFAGGIVMVTHDRTLINNTANKISELSPITHNFSHFRGGYKHYLVEQDKIYERAKLERENQEREIKHLREKYKDLQQEFRSSTNRRSPKDRDRSRPSY